MAISEETLRQVRKAFSDISKGYSVAFFLGKKIYIKHLTHHDQIEFEMFYKRYFDYAVSKGMKTEKQSLEERADIWTEEDEKQIEQHKTTISRLTDGKRMIILQSELQKQQKLIDEETEKLEVKLNTKREIVGLTAEIYAERKLNEVYVFESIFSDDKLSNKLYSTEEIEEISHSEMQTIVSVYNAEMSNLSDKNIKMLCIQDFFLAYWNFVGDDVSTFFGKAICHLSYPQLKLASYGRVFKNALQNADKIPDDIKEDPDRLLDYVRASENVKQQVDNSPSNNADAVATTIFGAKEQDYKSAGMESDGVNLMDALKRSEENGKKGLDMHDLMKLMGT